MFYWRIEIGLKEVNYFSLLWSHLFAHWIPLSQDDKYDCVIGYSWASALVEEELNVLIHIKNAPLFLFFMKRYRHEWQVLLNIYNKDWISYAGLWLMNQSVVYFPIIKQDVDDGRRSPDNSLGPRGIWVWAASTSPSESEIQPQGRRRAVT